MKKPFVFLFTLIALFALAIPFTTAQTPVATNTLVLTEQQVNDSYWVSNPRNRNITNVVVDLQPGQAVISSTYTRRTTPAGQTTSVALSVTMVPSVVNGRVQWAVTNATANGTAASGDLLNQINTHLGASWRRYISSTRPTGRLTDVTITDTELTLFYTS